MIIRSAVLVVLLGVLVAGCGREPAEKAGSQAQSSSQVEPAPPAGSETAPSGEAAAGNEVQLAGLLGCGHCTFHVTSECQPCVKTGAGDVYVIDGVPEGSDLWEKRLEEGHQITVAGSVLGTDKVKHVAMTSFEIK